MSQETKYTEDNIRSLDWKEHIRMRPGMYIGKLGDGSSPDDGIYILVKEVLDNSLKKVTSKEIEITKPPILQNLKRRNNSLSLKSIHQKKEQQKKPIEINYENHPKDSFSDKDLEKTWSNYQKLQIKKGEKSMASILATSQPELLENFKIHFMLPNKLMEDQLKLGKPKLLKFLRESLNNYSITINVTVSETVEKKFAYTPQEKYNKLKEKNPHIKILKDTFQLDL